MDKDINAVCDFLLEATEQAKALDLLPAEERGKLHGLPLSVKVGSLLGRRMIMSLSGVFLHCWSRCHSGDGGIDRTVS